MLRRKFFFSEKILSIILCFKFKTTIPLLIEFNCFHWRTFHIKSSFKGHIGVYQIPFVKNLLCLIHNHTNWMAVVTPADRPKSVRIRSVIEISVVFLLLIDCWIFCWDRGFGHRTESDLVLFPLLLKVSTILPNNPRTSTCSLQEWHNGI